MSEFVSLYLEASITEPNLATFLQSPTRRIEQDDDWLSWLMTGDKMVGNPEKLLEQTMNITTNQTEETLKELGIQYHYHASTQRIQFYHLHVDENFGQILPVVALLRGIAPYLEENEENFLIVYPYWWGSRETINDFITLSMRFINGKSFLQEKNCKRNTMKATAFFDEYGDKLAKEFYQMYGYF